MLVTEITAPPHVLAARLAARGRTADGNIRDRLARSDHVADRSSDIVIRNDGPLDQSCAAFIRALDEPSV
jgi:ribose 1,5-bisphosphokinase